MGIEDKVQAVLIADAGVVSLVPAAKIKTGFIGQGFGAPSIGHQAITNQDTRMSENRAGVQEWEYQISCFGATYSSAQAIARAVQVLFNDYKSVDLQVTHSTLGPHLRQDDLRISQIPVLLTLWDSF